MISGFESVNLNIHSGSQSGSQEWPVFAYDKLSPRTLLINHGRGVELVSFTDWIADISQAIDEEDDPVILEKVFREMNRSQVIHVFGRQKGALR